MVSVLSMLCSLLVFSFFSATILAAARSNKSEIDRKTLLCLKSGITLDPNGVLGSWVDDSLNFCSWRGVTCGSRYPSRVLHLEFNSAHLTGRISGCIGNLTSLSQINLNDNHLSGAIPDELAKLPSLRTLMLAANKLEGNIPDSLGTSMSLSYVNLANNTITGVIPDSIASSSSLVTLILSRNHLSGQIPANLFSNSYRLTRVDLQMNYLSGPIPAFDNVTALNFLSLTDNSLSGNIPPSMGNVSSLASILLRQNKIAGLIPVTLSRIPKLIELDLSYNSLVGFIPLSLYNMSSLTYFSLSNNGLVGEIPSDIGNSLLRLQILKFENNKLEGQIPTSLANATDLLQLDLSNNSLHGSIPSLGLLANLSQVRIGRNSLEAADWAFLSSLLNCTELIELSLPWNFLNGILPRFTGNLSTNLQALVLRGNQISGSIPSTIGKLHNLYILDLSINKLSGQIPSTIGNISHLEYIFLDDNNLSGNIPNSIWQCIGLLELNLSTNNLSGPIPSGLISGSPSRLDALLAVDLSCNNLTGQIPRSFVSIDMQKINLSRNELSGPVPVFFEDMRMLQLLDLSYNNFEGPIPTGGCFENASVVFLEGNTKLRSSSTILSFPICDGNNGRSLTKEKIHLPLIVLALLIVVPPFTILLFLVSWFLFTLWNRRVFSFPQCSDVLKWCNDVLNWSSNILKKVSYGNIKKITNCISSVNRRSATQQSSSYINTMKRVSYGDILKATNWFSPVNKISSSSTASVYIGRFEFEKDLVAIKVFHLDEQGAHNNFFTECEVLKHTRHRNLVKAITLCSTVDFENNEFKALVYEFMANGSLEMFVHPKLYQGSPKRVLTLGQRITIAADVSSALDYLHNQLVPPMIHCDLKPSNILLDYDMTSRVGDFGSAKFLSSNTKPDGFGSFGGTIGYIAPEYGLGCKISTAGDVYSFGVLLLEMLTAKRPTDTLFGNEGLHEYVHFAFPDRIGEVLDPHMLQEEKNHWMQSVIIPMIEIGLLCSMKSPKDRPEMTEVCAKIASIKQEIDKIM